MLEYRNFVILMLLHTPLLLNWVQEIHPARHRCDTSDMSLLCAFYHLATSYWHGDISQDTHNTDMERVWASLCSTTWSAVSVYSRQDPWRFMEAFFGQLEEELKDKDETIKNLQHFFGVGLRTRQICGICAEGSSEEERMLCLNASFRCRIPLMQPALYTVAEAINNHHFQFGEASGWTCNNVRYPIGIKAR